MRIHTLSTYSLLIISALILLSSCRVSKNIQTSRVNTDSLVTHVKDSMSLVHTRETSELRRMLEEMTSSGVTFVVDSCPEREQIYALLDSAGKANYDKMMLEKKLKSLSNKVTISEKGAITAEGQIKAAYFTNSKLQEELIRQEFLFDSLHRVVDSTIIKYQNQQELKNKVVKKSGGGWPWLLLILGIAIGSIAGWILKSRLVKPININNMKSILFILGLFTLASCGKFSDGTSVWADKLWIIPWVLFFGGAVFFYLAYRASKSNSTQQVPGGTKYNTGNIKITKLPKFWIGVALLIAMIVVIVVQNSEK